MQYLMLVVLSTLMLGCPAIMYDPVTKSLTVAEAPDATYQRATRAMQRFGGQLTLVNKEQRILSAVVKNAIVLNVSVTPAGEGSTVEVSGKLLQDKFVTGKFTEVDDYLALLQ